VFVQAITECVSHDYLLYSMHQSVSHTSATKRHRVMELHDQYL